MTLDPREQRDGQGQNADLFRGNANEHGLVPAEGHRNGGEDMVRECVPQEFVPEATDPAVLCISCSGEAEHRSQGRNRNPEVRWRPVAGWCLSAMPAVARPGRPAAADEWAEALLSKTVQRDR